MDEGPGAHAAGQGDALAADAEQLLRHASEMFKTGQIRSGAETAIRGAELARRAGRPDLLARAALVVTGVQDRMLDAAVEAMCRDALAAVDADDAALRARLHGNLAVALYHRGRIEEASAESEVALALAADGVDPAATAAAIHARQMVVQGLFRPAEQVSLADRMLKIAGLSAEQVMLAHVWRIEGYVQLGDTGRAAHEIDSLDALAARTDDPLFSWHAIRARAGLLQAVGRLDEAGRVAALARERISPTQASFLIPQYHAQQVMIALDRGVPPSEFDAVRALASGGPPLIRAVQGYLELVCGDVPAARASFAATTPRLADAQDETRSATTAALIVLATAFDDAAVAEALYRELAPHDGLVIGGALGVLGPVGYFLGLVDTHAGRSDEAIAHLEAAATLCARGDLGPSLARTRVALVDALVRRSAAGDRDRAAALASIAAADARRLGMAYVGARAAELEERLGRSPLKLSAREREIAGRIAKGLSNREIAAALVLSERTVETHVQNILTKLGFHARTQIAAWAVSAGVTETTT